MIAIVIPYYKIYFLDQLLSSLKNQTDQRFRVYIGNDNSPDDPEPIIDNYRDDLDITYKKFETNVGGKSLTKQWERCMDLIRDEDWFMLPGDDDSYGPNVIAKFYENKNKIEKAQIQVVKYATVLIDQLDQVTSDVYKHPEYEKSTDAFFRKFLGDSRSSICEYVFKTEQYRKYRFKDYPLAWGSDDMAFLQFSNFNLIYTINDAIAYYRYSNYNISGKDDKDVHKKNVAIALFFKDLLLHHLIYFKFKQKYYILKYALLYSVLSIMTIYKKA
jgi:glycosyltransferase involved in cell wall biosynthesis